MNIGIITHYDVHNHGAILQLNALAQVLRKSGHTANALQFDKNYDFMGIALKSKYNIGIRSIPYYIKYALQKGIKRTIFNINKRSLLNQFKKDNSLIGPFYTESGELDAVIIGSDEVFALHTGPTPVFFGYACPSYNVFSYAASFGPTTIEDIETLHCRGFVTGGINAMNGISVRDQNSHDIIIELTGKKAAIVADPVILYGYKEEIETMNRPDLPPYLLVYAYDNNMNDREETEAIKKYAAERDLKIVSAGFYHNWVDYNINVTPTELLNYIRHSECVVTDTFHGSVMSIIMNRIFAVKIRGNGNKLRFLLSEYGLLDRETDITNNLTDRLNEPIDYKVINDIIQTRRDESMAYLNGMLSIQ